MKLRDIHINSHRICSTFFVRSIGELCYNFGKLLLKRLQR